MSFQRMPEKPWSLKCVNVHSTLEDAQVQRFLRQPCAVGIRTFDGDKTDIARVMKDLRFILVGQIESLHTFANGLSGFTRPNCNKTRFIWRWASQLCCPVVGWVAFHICIRTQNYSISLVAVATVFIVCKYLEPVTWTRFGSLWGLWKASQLQQLLPPLENKALWNPDWSYGPMVFLDTCSWEGCCQLSVSRPKHTSQGTERTTMSPFLALRNVQFVPNSWNPALAKSRAAALISLQGAR